MAKRIAVINKLRPKIASQGVASLETLAERITKNTTYNKEEIYSILRLMVQESQAALQAGETVKVDGLVNLSPTMKVGGGVKLGLRADRGAIAHLNNPLLWTANKVNNHANIRKTSDELVALWNEQNPDDPVVE